jgi:hypothetical protein
VASLRVTTLAPEQGGQSLAGVRSRRRQRQVGQQGLCLARRQTQLGPRRHQAKAAKQLEREVDHGCTKTLTPVRARSSHHNADASFDASSIVLMKF